MSFLMQCPNCGERSAYEFVCGGDQRSRPGHDAPRAAWVEYLYWRENSEGVRREWWYHRHGCAVWFVAERNATTNEVLRTWLPEPAAAERGEA
jgi:sarcosine oxidase subunit delta